MNLFTVHHGNPNQQNEFDVHRKGCRDSVRGIQTFLDQSYEIRGETAEAAVAADVADYQDQDQGWDFEHYHVHNCAKAAR